jgi:hypothetical protein
MVGVAVAMKLISSWMQFGLLFAPETLKLDFNRLNPISQLKQMFSVQQLMNLLMSLAKALLIGLILYVVIRPNLSALINLATSDLQSYVLALIELFRYLLHACLGLLLVLALIDFTLQKHFFAKRMRMTQVEVVKEYKDMEGDPHVKPASRVGPAVGPGRTEGQAAEVGRGRHAGGQPHALRCGLVLPPWPDAVAAAGEQRHGRRGPPIDLAGEGGGGTGDPVRVAGPHAVYEKPGR